MGILYTDGYTTTGVGNHNSKKTYRYDSEGNKITDIVVKLTPDYDKNYIHVNIYKDGEELDFIQSYGKTHVKDIDLGLLKNKIKKGVR